MKELKLIVAGGCDFADVELMSRVIYAMADVEYADRAISIVSGMASGADALGYQFARQHNVKVYEYPADWKRLGIRAGFVRNEAMGRDADSLLAFWDGKSRGTNHMINFMKKLGKPVTVINY